MVFSVGIELAQLWVPGRHARVSDFLLDAAASCVGIGLSFMVLANKKIKAVCSLTPAEIIGAVVPRAVAHGHNKRRSVFAAPASEVKQNSLRKPHQGNDDEIRT